LHAEEDPQEGGRHHQEADRNQPQSVAISRNQQGGRHHQEADRNQSQSDAIRRNQSGGRTPTRKPIAVDASRVEASTSAWRSDVPPSATCGEKESVGRRREHSHAPPSGPAKRLLDL
jgi:hypothetical protein